MPLIPPTSAVKPPPWVTNNGNNVQRVDGNDFVPPWRKNLRSVPPPANVNNNVQEPPTPTETKTSKIQINLKSVKKPESVPPSIPKPESISNLKPVVTTTIPIQRTTVKEPPPLPQEIKIMGPPPPPAPPPPPGAPPPPPPPEQGNRLVKVEQLRKAPKKRPDWAGMMKEIEKGRVLNHVQCNDRSKPMISKLKSQGRFVYESEAKPASKKDALHNRILTEIQQGVKLKKVHCNDRSKPILTGLRLRRQSSVMDDGTGAPLLPAEPVDELSFLDIDVLRDELQSAKQMLSTEIDSKHNLEKKTRDQKCQIIAMEAEIETLKAKLGLIPEEDVTMLAKNLEKSDSKTFKHLRKSGSSLWKSPSIVGIKKSKSGLAKDIQLSKGGPSDANINKMDQEQDELMEVNEIEEEIVSLKEAVQHARKQAEEMEAKYKEAISKFQSVQNNFDESEQKRKSLEKKVENLEAVQEGKRPSHPVVQTAERTTQTEEQILEKTAAMMSQQQSTADAEEESEEESESDIEVDEEAVQRKKQERELKLWENKVKSIKDKQHTSRLERRNLKNLQKKLEAELKEANKRHKKLQKEVDKMAKMLKDVEKDEDEDSEEEKEEEEEEEEAEETEEEESEEEEEESDSDDDEDDEDNSSEEDNEDAAYDDRLAVFNKRVKRRENVLNALRKGNYLLRANIDRLKDDLEEARIAYHDLEHELNAVLDET